MPLVATVAYPFPTGGLMLYFMAVVGKEFMKFKRGSMALKP